MEVQQQAPASDQGSDSRDDASAIAREVSSRRQALGIPESGDGGDSRFEAMRRRLLECKVPDRSPEQLASIAEADEQQKVRESRERVSALIRQAGERYAGCRLTTFVVSTDSQKRVVQAVREYIDRPNRNHGLVLYGPCGTGKDHLAFSVAGYEAWNGSDVIWMYGQDWFGQVRDAMGDEGLTEAKLISRMCRPGLAVISDPLPPIGNLTVHQATMIYRVVQGRYQSGKPTIVTINVASDADADERMGAPTWDRLCDGAWKLFCNWPSHRKPAREVK